MKINKLLAGAAAVAAILTAPFTAPEAHAAAGAWTLTNATRTNILTGAVKTGDAFKVALYTSASNLGAASTTCTGVTGEVSATSTGYTTGGATVTLALVGTTSVTVSFATNPTWTAGSAGITAKFGGLCDTTADKVVAYFTLDSAGADVTASSGNTLTIDSDGTPSPVFTFS